MKKSSLYALPFFLIGGLLSANGNTPKPQPPNNPTTQQPNNPTTQQPNNPTTQQPNHPTTQQPNNPTTQQPKKQHLVARNQHNWQQKTS